MKEGYRFETGETVIVVKSNNSGFPVGTVVTIAGVMENYLPKKVYEVSRGADVALLHYESELKKVVQ
jgi:hypothetical protein